MTTAFVSLLAGLSLALSQEFNDCSIDAYYNEFFDSTTNLNVDLRQALSTLLTQTHRRSLSYTSSTQKDVWDALIDVDGDGDIIELFYSGHETVPIYPYGTPETWNREHIWPSSRGIASSSAGYTDLHHLRPTDLNVNAARGNLYFGNCMDDSCESPSHPEAANDTAKNSILFQPPAHQRGDVARALFYMATRYSNDLILTNCPLFENEMGFLSDLLEWHEQDPADEAERQRNDRICENWQGNRNVFVDFPELVSKVFGSDDSVHCVGNESTPSLSPQVPPLSTIQSCADMQSGDIFVAATASDDPDRIALVALRDMASGLDIYMTDNAWNGSEFYENEGVAKLTTNKVMTAGTIFGYGGGDNSLLYSGSWSGAVSLSTRGDNVMIYCMLDDQTVRHISAFSFGGDGWMPAGLEDYDSDASALPDDTASIALPHFDNYVYRGVLEGGKDEILESLMDPRNWEGSNTDRFDNEGCYRMSTSNFGSGSISTSVFFGLACFMAASLVVASL